MLDLTDFHKYAVPILTLQLESFPKRASILDSDVLGNSLPTSEKLAYDDTLIFLLKEGLIRNFSGGTAQLTKFGVEVLARTDSVELSLTKFITDSSIEMSE